MKEFKHMIICEDDTIVVSFDNAYTLVEDWQQPNLSVRVDLPDGDAEFVSVEELATLYRAHVMTQTNSAVWLRMELEKRGLVRYHGFNTKLAEQTGVHSSTFSAIFAGRRRCGTKLRAKIIAALDTMSKEE